MMHEDYTAVFSQMASTGKALAGLDFAAGSHAGSGLLAI
jgi:hypothetical protein